MSESPASTVVFYQGALGDSVLLWPLLRGLGPTAFVSGGEKATLAANHLPNVRPVDADGPGVSRLFASASPDEIDPRLRRQLQAARRIVSFVSDGDDTWAANVKQIAPHATMCFAPPRVDPASLRHATDQRLDQLARQGLRVRPVTPEGRINRGGPILVHPGSGGLGKCWSAERFETVIERLRRAGRAVAAVLGEAELDRWPGDRVTRWRSRFEVRVPRDLIDLADLVAGASGYLGNDAGPTHLAAQLGVRTVAIFGPTDPAVWAPRGPAVNVLAPDMPGPIDRVTVDEVLDAVDGRTANPNLRGSRGPA